MLSADIAIVGAGMAGAGLAAAIGARARVVLIEREAQPGYHATGRSAAFWSESYGGPQVQPLTTASGAWLAERGLLSPRGCLHLADGPEILDGLVAELESGHVAWEMLDRTALGQRIPGLAGRFTHGVAEPSCQDIDVAALHALFLRDAKAAGALLLCAAEVTGISQAGGRWTIATRAGEVTADLIVNAAGAWATPLAAMAGAVPLPIRPFRRTLVQLRTDPAAPPDLPLVMDARGTFYFKPEAGGRLWLSPHDETETIAQDVAPEELDQAIAIARFEAAVDWRVIARERAWAGLRSFAPDRLPVYGFDDQAPGFFWCAGQGGFGIQTAPAASALAAALLLGQDPPGFVAKIDMGRYAPRRFTS